MRWTPITNLCRLWMKNLWRIQLQQLMLILSQEQNPLKKDRRLSNNQVFYIHLILVKNWKCSQPIRMWQILLTMEQGPKVETRVRVTLPTSLSQLLLKLKPKSSRMPPVEMPTMESVHSLILRTLPNNSWVSIRTWPLQISMLKHLSVRGIKINLIQI